VTTAANGCAMSAILPRRSTGLVNRAPTSACFSRSWKCARPTCRPTCQATSPQAREATANATNCTGPRHRRATAHTATAASTPAMAPMIAKLPSAAKNSLLP